VRAVRENRGREREKRGGVTTGYEAPQSGTKCMNGIALRVRYSQPLP